MGLKIGGIAVDGPKRGILVLPREPDPLVFQFISVNNEDDFDKVYPPVVARRTYNVKLQQTIEHVEDPEYLKRLEARQAALRDWLFLKSIKPTEIEWVNVNLDDPTTFSLWQQDFRDAGLSTAEINVIFSKYIEVNALTQDMLDEARNSFLASRVVDQLAEQQRLITENQSSESGELAKDSA